MHYLDGLVAHDRILADLDLQGVEEHDLIHGFERSGLPSGDFSHDCVGHRADELR